MNIMYICGCLLWLFLFSSEAKLVINMTPTKRIGKKRVKFEEDDSSYQMDVDKEKTADLQSKSSPKKKHPHSHEEITMKTESDEEAIDVTPKRSHSG